MNYTSVLHAVILPVTCTDVMVEIRVPGRRKPWVTGCHTHPAAGTPPLASLR